jgi:hypothetical protein
LSPSFVTVSASHKPRQTLSLRSRGEGATELGVIQPQECRVDIVRTY